MTRIILLLCAAASLASCCCNGWGGSSPAYPRPVKNSAGKWGYIYGKDTVIPCIYDAASEFKGPDRRRDLAIVVLDGKSGVINRKGEAHIPVIYDYISDQEIYSVNSSRFLVELKGKCGALSRKGKVKVPIIYEEMTSFNYWGLAWIKANGKTGVIDKNGKVLLPPRYEGSLNDFHESCFQGLMLRNGDKYGFINAKGKLTTAFEFDEVKSFCYDGYELFAVVKRNGKYGAFDVLKGRMIVPVVFDEFIFIQPCEAYYEKAFYTRVDGAYRIISKNGNELPFKQDDDDYPHPALPDLRLEQW
jgi:hypothetical protein